MNKKIRRFKQGAALALSVLVSAQAMAGVPIYKEGDKSITLGAAMRTSLDLGHAVPPANSVWGNDMSVSFDIYSDFDLSPGTGFTLNLTYGGAPGSVADTVELMDLVARYKQSNEVQFWAGRIVPNTRSNISGPYFMAPWNYPAGTDIFPAFKYGRDDGAVLWGDLGGTGMYKYFVGAFEGRRPPVVPGVNPDSNPEAIAKVVLNLMDGETGYYHSSTYYGTKKILAISLASAFQSYAYTAPPTNGNLTATTLDILYEMPFEGIGTITAEAAGFYYDNQDSAAGSQFKGSSLLLGYLLPGNKIHTFARYESKQEFPIVLAYGSKEDYGVSYLFDSYNNRVGVNYSNTKANGVTFAEGYNIFSQLMF